MYKGNMIRQNKLSSNYFNCLQNKLNHDSKLTAEQIILRLLFLSRIRASNQAFMKVSQKNYSKKGNFISEI